jgi:DNA-binding response OmpR family regulator
MLEQRTVAASAGIPSQMVFDLFVERIGEEFGRPLHPEELKEEVDQILARYGIPSANFSSPETTIPKTRVLGYGGFKIDTAKGEYFLHDVRLLGFSPQEQALLTYFVEMQGFPVTTTTLMELCWNNKSCKDETTIRNHIGKLKAAFEDITDKKYIGSVRMAKSSLRQG